MYRTSFLLVALITTLACWQIKAEPAYFQNLAEKAYFRRAGQIPELQKDRSFYELSDAEKQLDFIWKQVNFDEAIRYDFAWNSPELQKQLQSFAAKGELRNLAIAVHCLKDQEIQPIISDFVCRESNRKIDAKNVRIQYLNLNGNGKQWSKSNAFFFADFPLKAAVKETQFLIVSIYTPTDSKAGLYEAEMTIGSTVIPLKLRVLNLDFQYPEGAWGAYTPGHYYTEQTRWHVRNYSPEWFNKKNLKNYLQFLQRRGINSPVLFHVYLPLKLIDGKVEADFSFLRELSDTMKEVGMSGPVGLDTRFWTWWCHSAAIKLRSLKMTPEQVVGDLGVSYLDARSMTLSGASYGEMEKQLYAEVIKLTVKTAEEENWIDYFLFTEEEIGFPTDKTLGYEAFNPTLMREAGRDKVALIDNSVGYLGSKNRIERAARDNIKFRSYNNWTAEAIEDIRKNDAEVWNYNHGWRRDSSGFRTEQLDAKAYHQWALNWFSRDPHPIWAVLLMDEDGRCVSSLELEDFQAGLCDLFYYQKFNQYCQELDNAANSVLAEKLRQFKSKTFSEVPINRIEYFTYIHAKADNYLETLRYKYLTLMEEARKALGKESLQLYDSPRQASGTGKLQVFSAANPQMAKSQNIIYAGQIDSEITIDGEGKERAWYAKNNIATAFRFSSIQEASIRAHASTEEEFKQKATPSASSARVIYDDKGLYILSGQNHASPKTNCNFESGSEQLWKDDCIEFFFNAGEGQPQFQLIVNSRGNYTLIKNEKLLKDNSIQVAIKSPINASGGVQQEIFIPWKDLDCKSAPVAGTIWRFNVGREFHSWNQLSMWAQTAGPFGLSTGQICFAGFDNEVESEAKLTFEFENVPEMHISGYPLKIKISISKDVDKMDLALKSKNFNATEKISLKAGLNEITIVTSGLPAEKYKVDFNGLESSEIEFLPDPFN